MKIARRYYLFRHTQVAFRRSDAEKPLFMTRVCFVISSVIDVSKTRDIVSNTDEVTRCFCLLVLSTRSLFLGLCHSIFHCLDRSGWNIETALFIDSSSSRSSSGLERATSGSLSDLLLPLERLAGLQCRGFGQDLYEDVGQGTKTDSLGETKGFDRIGSASTQWRCSFNGLDRRSRSA